jgi:hypothetical protein
VYLSEVHPNAQRRKVDAALVQPHTHKQKQRHDDDEANNEQPGQVGTHPAEHIQSIEPLQARGEDAHSHQQHQSATEHTGTTGKNFHAHARAVKKGFLRTAHLVTLGARDICVPFPALLACVVATHASPGRLALQVRGPILLKVPGHRERLQFATIAPSSNGALRAGLQ